MFELIIEIVATVGLTVLMGVAIWSLIASEIRQRRIDKAYEDAMKRLYENLERENGDWTLIKDNLPKENGRYLVSYEDAVTILNFFNGKWVFPVNGNGCIAHEEIEPNLAWMPLPEPCKELK